MKETITLDAKQRAIIPIAALTAKGDIENLRIALNEGLDAGLTINDAKEVLVQMYAYTGFPRSLNGINALMAVVDERAQRGIKDEIGKDSGPMPADIDKDKYGADVRAQLTGVPVTAPRAKYQEFAPVIDTYLKEHLFADIFWRDVLDFKQREIATISALASLGGAEAQLRSHLGISMNIGLSEAQLREYISVLRSKVGEAEASTAEQVLNGIMRSIKTNP